jgi:MFS family permease
MEYFRLFYFNKKLLSLGILLTFFSGFGKTFLISQYIPFFVKDFNLSITDFCLIYAFATIASGIAIIYIGRMIDNTELKKYAIMITFGLTASTLLLSFSQNIFFLAIAVFGLRLSGQGLMNHTCFTVISRYFKRCRGKAISISVIGHALGEAILPIATVLLIFAYGWRNTLIITAGFMFITLIPPIAGFFKNIPKAKEDFLKKIKRKKKLVKEEWTINKILRGNQFYLLAPIVFILPFIFTGLMFFMVPISNYKGWTIEWMSYCFIGFACANLFSSFTAGQLVDRFKARRLLPFYLLPLIAGIACILIFDGAWTAIVYLTLAGFTVGSGMTTETSVIVEIYGMKNIGTVKSLFSTIAIIGSALGPLVMGSLLDAGFNFDFILFISLSILSVISLNSFRSYSRKHKTLKSVWSIPKVMLFRRAV